MFEYTCITISPLANKKGSSIEYQRPFYSSSITRMPTSTEKPPIHRTSLTRPLHSTKPSLDRHTFLLSNPTQHSPHHHSRLSFIIQNRNAILARETGLDNLGNRANRHQMEKKKKKRNTYLEQKEKKEEALRLGRTAANRKGNENSSRNNGNNGGGGLKRGHTDPSPLSLLVTPGSAASGEARKLCASYFIAVITPGPPPSFQA